MLKPVPLFGTGTAAKSVKVSAQERINMYVELPKDNEGTGIALYPTPGLSSFVNFGANPARGLYEKGDSLYEVNGSTLWEIAADGTTTSRGTLLTSGGRVDISDNGDEMLIVDGTYGYIYTFATETLAQITDTDFVAGDTCDFLNGRFLVQRSDSGQFCWSAILDGTSWGGLDFATAESSPDNLVRVKVDSGVLYLFGDSTVETWGDSGAEDVPYARIGASAMQWGLAARWSLAKFGDSLMCLRKNRLGGLQVCMVSGSNSVAVSTPEVEQEFSTYSAVANATAFSYSVGGHPMYQINFPSEGISWLYDGLSKNWNKVRSGSGLHRGEIQINFQNRSYLSDYENGKLYLIDQDAYTDDGETIVRQVVTRHSKGGEYLRLSRLWIEVESGVGLASGQGSDPQIMLQISRDGGKTWGAEMWRPLGKLGEYKRRAVWNRLGRAYDFVFRFRVTDPVKLVILAGWAQYE